MNIGAFLIYTAIYVIMSSLILKRNIIIGRLKIEAGEYLKTIIKASMYISVMELRIKELEEETERLKGCK